MLQITNNGCDLMSDKEKQRVAELKARAQARKEQQKEHGHSKFAKLVSKLKKWRREKNEELNIYPHF